MSGHSKWATTKHRKGAQDAKRSAMFSKLSRIITVAAKEGNDPNPDNNASLAAAIAKAKGYSMPKDKIQAAIDKAFGNGADAATWETVIYEGYGPAGIGLYVECLTDNRNRTAADVRSAFTKSGGSLATSGAVAFQFEKKGQIILEKVIEGDGKKVADRPNCDMDEDEFTELLLEVGGDDFEDAGEEWIIYTEATEVMAVKSALEEQGIEVKGAEQIMEPTNPVAVSVEDARRSSASSTAWRTSTTSSLSPIPWRSRTRSPRHWRPRRRLRASRSRGRSDVCGPSSCLGLVILQSLGILEQMFELEQG